MMATLRPTRTRWGAAKLHPAAPLASGYERSLRPYETGVSRPAGTIRTKGGHR
jgi:hypothetical protein